WRSAGSTSRSPITIGSARRSPERVPAFTRVATACYAHRAHASSSCPGRMSELAPSRRERAYLDIRGRIVAGEYPPGAPLSESALTRVVRASRTPIREALCRLLEEGYVERVPGRGFQVSRITVRLVQDTFEVRRLLEGTAAARAAEVAARETVSRLRHLAPVPFVAGDLGAAKRAEKANAEFHLAVAEASGNALLVD